MGGGGGKGLSPNKWTEQRNNQIKVRNEKHCHTCVMGLK